MNRKTTFAVVSRPADAPPGQFRVFTAEQYLGGEGEVLRPGITVLNLCRSWRYLSKGYYVSLLADARAQTVIPSVDTIEALTNADAVFRRLQEAGIDTIELSELRARRKGLGSTIARTGSPGAHPLVRTPQGDTVAFRPASDSDIAETLIFLGRAADRRFVRIAATVHKIWPCPVLRLRLLREDSRWKVFDLGPVRFHRLTRPGRDEFSRSLRNDRSGTREAIRDKEVSLAILYDPADRFRPSSEETIQRFERVAAEMGVHAHRLSTAEVGRVGEYDALFVRTLTGLDQPAFRFALHAEALGMPVIDDSRSIIRCGNKVFLSELLTREGVAIPKTVTARPDTPFSELEAELGLPFIIKVPDGSFSAAVFKISSAGEYAERTAELFENSPLLIAQEYMRTDFDWRITVLDGKPLFCCRYHMARGHWQILASTGAGMRSGRVEAVPCDRAPRAVVRLACRAAALIGTGLFGVDIKEGPRGPVVIEVNDNPNIDLGYEDAAEGDEVYRAIVTYFVGRLRPRSQRAPKVPKPPPPRDPRLAGLREPIGRPDRAPVPPHRAFAVCGIELEYMVVDRDLNVIPEAGEVLSALAGRPTSDVEMGLAGYSNEIFDHVIEMKNAVPLATISECEEVLVEAVRRAALVLGVRYKARLLPTGMHPWFVPSGARLWSRSNQKVYRTYERLFEVRTHGWANVQASHVNLPLGREGEAVAMMNAAALLTPYLPALAASSPLIEGDPGPAVDNRLDHILTHQRRIPESTGEMIPEYVQSLAQYRRDVLKPMYAAADRLEDAGAIRHEFLNARAAVFKFSRKSMEVRALDMQECVRMDAAIAAFVRGALRGLAGMLRGERLELPDRGALLADFRATVAEGTAASVRAPHLAPNAKRGADGLVPVRAVLASLLPLAEKNLPKRDRPYMDLVAGIIDRGTLSERILAALTPHLGDEDGYTEAARRIYIRLADCLVDNEPWNGDV